MKATIDVPSGETAGVSAGTVIKQRLTHVESSDPGSVPDEMFERARNASKHLGASAMQRTVLLGVLLAELDGVPFDAAAEILKVKPARLAKMMHGEEQIPASREPRWQTLAESLHNLHGVIRREATWRWLNTEIPALGGRTPYNVILRRGGPEQVKALTSRYLDRDFT